MFKCSAKNSTTSMFAVIGRVVSLSKIPKTLIFLCLKTIKVKSQVNTQTHTLWHQLFRRSYFFHSCRNQSECSRSFLERVRNEWMNEWNECRKGIPLMTDGWPGVFPGATMLRGARLNRWMVAGTNTTTNKITSNTLTSLFKEVFLHWG